MTPGMAGHGWVAAAVVVGFAACSPPATQEALPPGCAFADVARPGEVDVPPVRHNADVRSIFVPVSPPAFRRAPPPGSLVRVRVRLRVDADGRITDGCVIEATTPAAGAVVLERIRERWRYVPATRDGRAIPTTVLETVEGTVGGPRIPTLEEVLRSRLGEEGRWKPRPEQVRVFESTDAASLERAVMDPAPAVDFRVDAYARLGELGTPEALDAIDRIERAFADAPIATATAGVVRQPGVHGGLGVQWAVWADSRYGKPELVLSWRVGTGAWARARLAPVSPGLDVTGIVIASWNGETVVVRHAPRPALAPFRPPGTRAPGSLGSAPPRVREWTRRLDIAGILRDSDGDGWTDLEEERFGIDPASPDTDRDGIPDGRDVCPALARPAAQSGSEDDAILATAVFSILGLTTPPGLMLPVPGTPQLHLWGLAGPVIYGRPLMRLTADSNRYEGARFVFWDVDARTADAATARVEHATGGTAGEGYHVYLRRMRGRWYVVAVVQIWIS